MLSILIIIALFMLGIILIKKDSDGSSWKGVVGIGLVVCMGVGIALCAFSTISVQINKDVEYQNRLHEKEMLEYRIDNMNEDIVGNEMLYNDIVAFNNELRQIKKWANNPFTNWFYVQEIATIDYVELDGN